MSTGVNRRQPAATGVINMVSAHLATGRACWKREQQQQEPREQSMPARPGYSTAAWPAAPALAQSLLPCAHAIRARVVPHVTRQQKSKLQAEGQALLSNHLIRHAAPLPRAPPTMRRYPCSSARLLVCSSARLLYIYSLLVCYIYIFFIGVLYIYSLLVCWSSQQPARARSLSCTCNTDTQTHRHTDTHLAR